MCLHRRQLDPQSRRIYAAGNLCLVSSLLPALFYEHGFGHHHPVIFDGLRFLLLVCAVGLLFWSARRNCGCASRS